MTYVIYYLATLIPLVALDVVWILGLAKKFYATHMGFLFSKNINLVPAGFFYPLYAFGVLVLVVLPAIKSGSWSEALWRGALLGLVSYGAYDLTNHATIAQWPFIMTIVDMGWGTLVTTLTSVIAFFVIGFLSN